MVTEAVFRYMDEHGFKQRVIAKKAGLSEQAISDMRNGRRKMLAEEFFPICKAMNADPNQFMPKEETPPG